jgi:hypothetical protein
VDFSSSPVLGINASPIECEIGTRHEEYHSHLDRTIMSQELHVCAFLVQLSKLCNQCNWATTQSFRHMQSPLSNLFFGECTIGGQWRHQLLYLFFSQGIVFKWHGRFSQINFGRENVVYAKLAGKDVAHDMHRLLMIFLIRKAVQNVCNSA